MKIALDVSPLTSDHKGRGIGTYTRELVTHLNQLKVTDTFISSDQPYRSGADLVHFPYFDLFFHTLPLNKPKPTVVTVHDCIPLLFPEHYPKGIRGATNLLLQRLSLLSVSHVITDSVASKNDLIHHFSLHPTKITAIPLAASPQIHPVSTKKIDQIRRQYHLPQKFLLYVGDINYHKNLPNLILAMRQVKALPLIIVTRAKLDQPIPEAAAINQALATLSSPDQVQVIPVDDQSTLSGFYQAATFYIQPSLAEGFGLPVLEAMACGTPVLSSNLGSLPEVGGDACVYFDPTSPQSIALAINQALQYTPNRYQTLKKMATVQAAQFSWSTTAKATQAIYHQVLSHV